MAPKFKVGQTVIVSPVKGEHLTPRDSALEPFAGQTGEIRDYYWLSPETGEAFYIYTVGLGPRQKELVLHEDELQAHPN